MPSTPPLSERLSRAIEEAMEYREKFKKSDNAYWDNFSGTVFKASLAAISDDPFRMSPALDDLRALLPRESVEAGEGA